MVNKQLGPQSRPATKFFVPGSAKSTQETDYQTIMASITDQMRWPITPRRIFRLEYVHDKKPYVVQVGQLEQLENHYEIRAILESNAYIIVARSIVKHHNMTILVSKDEVTEVVEFD